MDDEIFLQESRRKLDNLIIKKNIAYENIKESEKKSKDIQGKLNALTEAKIAISSEMNSIQKLLKEDIDSLVTTALKIVYEGRNLEFSMDFERNSSGNSQYKPYIIENGEKFSPKDEQCGGALDVISYALRIILHSFENPKGRSFMFLDEPFKFLGGGILAEKAVYMAKKINNDIGIQCVMISHDEVAINSADIIYNIYHDGLKSYINNIKGSLPQKTKKIKRIRSKAS